MQIKVKRSSVIASVLLLHSCLKLVPVICAFSFQSSSFTGTQPVAFRISSYSSSTASGRWTMYDSPFDPPGSDTGSSPHNAWAVLSNTEKWISNTLQTANVNSDGANNPYARKEVSYICENQSNGSMIVAGIFRRLREIRECGEAHCEAEADRAAEQGEVYRPATMRQTHVVVIPSNEIFTESFAVFDELINNINEARRNARDYVTDTEDAYEDADREWSVAINCAHLHPSFGERTAVQQLQDLKNDDEAGEVDVNLEQYKQMRLQARRSPYPTVVIEVRVQPSPAFDRAPPSVGQSSEHKVSIADVQKLEALFGKQAHISGNDTADSSFWDAVGNSIQEVISVTPLKLGEQWITQHTKPLATAAFTETSASHVDAAYEFVFTNIAMLQENKNVVKRQYIIMPNFLPAAATSLEKFAAQAHKLSGTLSDLEKLTMEVYHPEHIDPSRRSPMSILAISLS